MDSTAESTPASAGSWIGRAEITRIAGALQASAYVARAYLMQKHNHGVTPLWARKQPNGNWIFDSAYIHADARANLDTLGITEAAKLLGATRRAVQTWVDDGVIQATDGQRAKGVPRRILREPFMRAVPELKQRLERRPAALPSPADGVPAQMAESRLLHALEQQAAQAESRLAAGLKRKLDAAAQRRRQLVQERTAAEQAAHAADRSRQAAVRLAERSTAREQAAAARETDLRKTLTEQLAAWRSRSAARISQQLRDARDAWRRAAAPAAPQPNLASRRQSAAAVAEQLQRARDSHQQISPRESEAVAVAEQIAEEVERGRLDRYDAAIRFHDAMERRDMPTDIRVAVMKRYFSK